MNHSMPDAAHVHWRLDHRWSSVSDRAALSLCRETLHEAGIDFLDALPQCSPDAVKMHGMEMVDAVAAGYPLIADVTEIAHAQQWAQRLPAFVRCFMASPSGWHGIPLGIHRANMAWVNKAVAQRIDGVPPSDFFGLVAWLHQAAKQVPLPLAVGGEPWQIGVLFESLTLAVAGPDFYHRALVQWEPQALSSPEMVRVLDSMLVLREFVDGDLLTLGWADQLARVQRADAAIQVMGDWVQASHSQDILPWAVPGTDRYFVSVVDFFVPLKQSAAGVTSAVAKALTQADFQRAFAATKGCMPALHEVWESVDMQRASLLGDPTQVLPSLTFDQSCSVVHQGLILKMVADHFIHRKSSRVCSQSLADLKEKRTA